MATKKQTPIRPTPVEPSHDIPGIVLSTRSLIDSIRQLEIELDQIKQRLDELEP